MASFADRWMKEYDDAVKLSNDISIMISDASSVVGVEEKRHSSTIRRKITILRTKLDDLPSLLVLARTRTAKPISEKEMNRRFDMASSLREKVEEMASTMNMSNFGRNRDILLGQNTKSEDAMNQTVGLDNQGIVNLQNQIIKEQDQDLEKLEETMKSTKHISLAIREEFDLHERLIDTVDQHVEATSTRLLLIQKKLARLNKIVRRDGYTVAISAVGIVLLLVTIYFLIKYLKQS